MLVAAILIAIGLLISLYFLIPRRTRAVAGLSDFPNNPWQARNLLLEKRYSDLAMRDAIFEASSRKANVLLQELLDSYREKVFTKDLASLDANAYREYKDKILSHPSLTPELQEAIIGLQGPFGGVLVWRSDEDTFRLALSPDGQFILSATDCMAKLWKYQPKQAPELIATFIHDNGVRSVAFSPDGKFVLTASDDQFARLWKAEASPDPKPVKVFDCEEMLKTVNHETFIHES